jgi:serine/threonine-protein kinase
MSKILVCAECGRQYREPASRCSADGSALCGPEALTRVGQRLGNYELLAIEGVGGMGVVYKGRHAMLGKPVAIKVLHDRYARRDGAIDQFLREAQAATRIRHPNIVDVTDFGTAPDGSVYFVMEYLEGISLETVLGRDGLVPLFNAVNIVRQAARALGAAHDEGIVHRDLKPENIYLINREGRRRVVRRVSDDAGQRFVVEKEGNFDFVKLLDFGVAKYITDDVGPGMSTRAGMIFGTPHYMSPEQARGELVDGRSDIYALGIVFYEMITGAVPFEGEVALDILNGHVYGQVIPPKMRNPAVNVDEGTDLTIMRCLEKDPARRYQTMWEFTDALSACFTDQVFLRDAHRLPGAVEAGIVPPQGEEDLAAPANAPGSAAQSPSSVTGPRPPSAAMARPSSADPAKPPSAVAPAGLRKSITSELSELFSSETTPVSGPPPASAPQAAPAAPVPSPEVSPAALASEVVLLTPKQAKPPREPTPPPAEELPEENPRWLERRTRTNPGLGVVAEAVLASYIPKEADAGRTPAPRSRRPTKKPP